MYQTMEGLEETGLSTNSSSSSIDVGDGDDRVELLNLSTISRNDMLPDEFSVEVKTLLVFLYVLIVVTAVCGNFLVITVVVLSRQLRTVTNVFFVSLAVSDVLIAVINMPFQLLYYVHNEWTIGEAMCKLTNYIQGVVVVSSILTLTGIAIDRYYAICRPLQARRLHTLRRAVTLIVVFWLLSLVLLSPQLFVQRLEPILVVDVHNPSSSTTTAAAVPEVSPGTTLVPAFSQPGPVHRSATFRLVYVCVEFFPDDRLNVLYTLSYYAALCVVPVMIMLITYGRIAATLWSQTPPGESPETNNEACVKRLSERKRVVRMLVIIVVVFVLSWLPFFTAQVYTLFDSNDAANVTSLRTLVACLQLLAYTNCAVNPLIYCLLNERFQLRMRKMATAVKCFAARGRHRNVVRRRRRHCSTTSDGHRVNNNNIPAAAAAAANSPPRNNEDGTAVKRPGVINTTTVAGRNDRQKSTSDEVVTPTTEIVALRGLFGSVDEDDSSCQCHAFTVGQMTAAAFQCGGYVNNALVTDLSLSESVAVTTHQNPITQ